MESELDEYNEAFKKGKGYIYARFAKVLCFLKVCLYTPFARIQGPQITAFTEKPQTSKNENKTICSIDFYELLNEGDLNVD